MDIKILKAHFDATHSEYEIPEEPEWFNEDEVGYSWDECFFLFLRYRRNSDDFDE